MQQDAFENINPAPIQTPEQNQINPEKESEAVDDEENQDSQGDDSAGEILEDNLRVLKVGNSQITN